MISMQRQLYAISGPFEKKEATEPGYCGKESMAKGSPGSCVNHLPFDVSNYMYTIRSEGQNS